MNDFPVVTTGLSWSSERIQLCALLIETESKSCRFSIWSIMDRPLGKKFEPRPKRIQRSDGSYWVANPCVSEHFLTKQIGDIDRQKAMFSSAQSRQQRQLHQDLNNIKATKNCREYKIYRYCWILIKILISIYVTYNHKSLTFYLIHKLPKYIPNC